MNIDSQKREYGVFYTPEELSDYLLSGCGDSAPTRVLDPSCGEGALLFAAQKKFGVVDTKYFGCDKRHMRIRNRYIKVKCSDFFDYNPGIRFDLVVTNPPYVRSDKSGEACRKWYEEKEWTNFKLDGRADLWVYFLLKSISLLEEDGNLAAILPWSFIQAEYACALREYLHRIFRRILIHTISDSCFSDTPQKVVVLWLWGKGSSCTEIRACCSSNFKNSSLSDFRKIALQEWLSGDGFRDVKSLDTSFDDVHRLGDICDVRIGIVTGATKFFVREKHEILQLGVAGKDCPRIVTACRELRMLNLFRKDTSSLKCLMHIGAENAPALSEVIKDGEKLSYDKRRHCRQRKIWYSVSIPTDAPDAFFTYRATAVPVMTLNDAKVYNTNSVHGIYFKDVNISADKMRWIQVSMLSAFSLLDIELKARIYGKNVLKIEPTALKSVRVYAPDRSIDATKVDEIDLLIRQGKRVEAVIVATKYIFSEMRLSYNLQTKIMAGYKRLWEQRTGRKIFENQGIDWSNCFD